MGAVRGDDDVRRVEIPVAELDVVRHGVQPRVQLVAGRRVEVRRADLAVHLVLQKPQAWAHLALDLELDVHELLEIFVLLLRFPLHQGGERLPFDELGHDRPLIVHGDDAEDFRDVQAGLLDTGLAERLGEDVRLRVSLFENLDALVPVAADGLAAGDRYDLIKIHFLSSVPVIPRPRRGAPPRGRCFRNRRSGTSV